MSLDVYLVGAGEELQPGQLVCQFDWDGYFQFLSAFWPPTSSSGKVINLFGNAYFAGPNLPQLRAALDKAQAALASRPAVWKERIGTAIRPKPGPKLATVRKVELEKTINTLRAAIQRAEAGGLEVRFIGD